MDQSLRRRPGPVGRGRSSSALLKKRSARLRTGNINIVAVERRPLRQGQPPRPIANPVAINKIASALDCRCAARMNVGGSGIASDKPSTDLRTVSALWIARCISRGLCFSRSQDSIPAVGQNAAFKALLPVLGFIYHASRAPRICMRMLHTHKQPYRSC